MSNLIETEKGLVWENNGQKIYGDLTKMIRRLKPNNLGSELLVKASRMKNADHPLIAVDATAGLGEDSLLLAAAGFLVEMYEYDEIIFKLLNDSLKRAKNVPELSDVVSKMRLHFGNSIDALKNLSYQPDVVYLDPMFPKREKTAQVKKKFQMIHEIELPCDVENDLMEAAIASKAKRIIVKRPIKAPTLANRKPSYTLTGKNIRYDCIVL